MMMTGHDLVSCPYCDAPRGQRVACEFPAVQAWSCGACDRQWWLSLVNPGQRPFLDQLIEDVTAQVVLWEVNALAEQVAILTPGQLLARLIGCLARLDQVARRGPLKVPDS